MPEALARRYPAFEALVVRYEAKVRATCFRILGDWHEAENQAQEVFIKAFQSLAGWRQDGHFRAWLSVIAVRTCYDYWRKHYRSREVPMSVLTEKHQKWLEEVITEHSEQAIIEKGSQDEARELLDWALGKLTAEDRMVLELVYL